MLANVRSRALRKLTSRSQLLFEGVEGRALGMGAYSAPASEQSRHINLFDVFSKEKMTERRAKLKEDKAEKKGITSVQLDEAEEMVVQHTDEDMQRGYFDDFKDLRETGGKMFPATEQLISAKEAVPIPPIQAEGVDGKPLEFPPALKTLKAALLCMAFRGGAEEMLSSWSLPFRTQYAGRDGVRVYEVSLVESKVMSLPPFRQMIRQGASSRPEDEDSLGVTVGLPPEFIYYFGDCTEWRRAMQMTNRLTGYVFLMDGNRRVRWRGSGKAAQEEVDSLLSCTRQLLAGK